ncbi:MAG: hypothetical protein ACJ76Z_07430 [Thermoleophilaceae bacterium]
MEHHERLDEREQEIRSQVDDLAAEGDQMEERSDDVQKDVDEVREEFERKQEAGDVPGAQPPGGRQDTDGTPEEAQQA